MMKVHLLELKIHPCAFTFDSEKAYNKLLSTSEKVVSGILIAFKYLTTGIIDAIKDAIANANFKTDSVAALITGLFTAAAYIVAFIV